MKRSAKQTAFQAVCNQVRNIEARSKSAYAAQIALQEQARATVDGFYTALVEQRAAADGQGFSVLK